MLTANFWMFLGWSIRVHIVRVLLDFVPILLVERRQVPGAGSADASVPLDHRLERRGYRDEIKQAQGSLLCLPVPHHHELHTHLSQGRCKQVKQT